jgi:hypothetical protein
MQTEPYFYATNPISPVMVDLTAQWVVFAQSFWGLLVVRE